MIAEMLQAIYEDQEKQGRYPAVYGPRLIPLLRRLEQEAGSGLTEILNWQRCRPGHYLLKQGNFSDRVFILLDGIAGEYMQEEGREVFVHFYLPGGFIANYTSMVGRQPSRTNIRLMTRGRLITIERKAFEQLEAAYPVVNTLTKIIAGSILEQYKYHSFCLQACNAGQRYERFCRRYPLLASRLALKDIAGYIGILLSSLSRIRSQR
jgi:CRP-like cAMP-binding protein